MIKYLIFCHFLNFIYIYNFKEQNEQLLMNNTFTHHSHRPQTEEELDFIESMEQALQVIVAQLHLEKNKLLENWEEERRYLMTFIQEKQNKIERLQNRIHQLQKQNQQVKYQYGQRINLMNIVKRQNWIITKQFSEEKAQINLALDYLVAENQKLQQKIITYQHSVHPQIRLQTPKRYLSKRHLNNKTGNTNQDRFHSMNDLHQTRYVHDSLGTHHENNTELEWMQMSIEKRLNENEDGKKSSSLIATNDLKRRGSYFKESRATEVKSSNRQTFNRICEISTKTLLSRQPHF